jgi:hypothetical protein
MSHALKTLTIAAALLAGAASLAVAQNGLPTGGEPPVAGGAGGNPLLDYGQPADIAQPGYVAAPRVHSVHHRTSHRSTQ